MLTSPEAQLLHIFFSFLLIKIQFQSCPNNNYVLSSLPVPPTFLLTQIKSVVRVDPSPKRVHQRVPLRVRVPQHLAVRVQNLLALFFHLFGHLRCAGLPSASRQQASLNGSDTNGKCAGAQKSYRATPLRDDVSWCDGSRSTACLSKYCAKI